MFLMNPVKGVRVVVPFKEVYKNVFQIKIECDVKSLLYDVRDALQTYLKTSFKKGGLSFFVFIEAKNKQVANSIVCNEISTYFDKKENQEYELV